MLNPDLAKILVRNPDLGKSLGAHGGEMPDPDLERVCNPDFPAMPKSGLGTGHKGIGVIFNTRKGYFQYKISVYIITYHVAIIVYHCVSSSISQYIMSLGDT